MKIRIKGRRACFTRPEFKAERRSYDAITPTAAQGFLESIYWKPEMEWVIHRIIVENPIQFMTVTINEVERPGGSESHSARDVRIQRTSTILCDVSYVVEATIRGNEAAKHVSIATRRLRQKQSFQQPYLGCREFIGDFELLDDKAEIKPVDLDRKLGMMFRARVWSDAKFPGTRHSTKVDDLLFFEAEMTKGVIEIPRVAA